MYPAVIYYKQLKEIDMEKQIESILKYARQPMACTGRTRVCAPVLDSLTVNGVAATVYRTDTEAEFAVTYKGRKSSYWYVVDMAYSQVSYA